MLNSFLRAKRSSSAPVAALKSSAVLRTALLAGSLLSVFAGSAIAETPAALPMITQRVDNASRVTLKGTVHPMAKLQYDRGAVEPSFQAPRLQLMLKRPADRETALKQFIAGANTKGSATYHKWLTPDQFGKQYGPADSDVEAVKAWLQSQGLTVNKVSHGKSIIEFGGSAAQIQTAFGTSIHKYIVKGETHYANASAVSIPSALAPAVSGVVSLSDFSKMKPQVKVLGSGTYTPKTHKGTGNWNDPNQGTFYVGPGDFAVQYDTAPLISAGTDGTGVTIGIINDSNIDIALVNAYRSIFSLPASTPQVVIDGNDPGVNGDSIEAYLDVEQAGAVAPGATINLYVAASTSLIEGLDLATARAVDDDAAQILNLSFGDCELELSTENTFYAEEWEQAAAQGQTVMVSSGDAGSEQCYVNNDSAGNPIYGLAVNGSASTPYNIAVGGTDFYYSDYASTPASSLPASFTTYWTDPLSQSNTPNTSIAKYIPEQPWNDSIYGLNVAVVNGFGSAATTPDGGGGGVSSCSLQDTSGNCTGGYPKPSYQSGITPADSVRDLPDVSLFAANGYNLSAYAICANPGDCNSDGQVVDSSTPVVVTGVGGTSASSPAFAGIMSMVVQKYGAQGQANYVLYPLHQQYPAAFHDVTVGSNNSPCDPTATTLLTPCTLDTGSTTNYSVHDYPAATGYDLASGLGSVDANVMVADWNKITFTGTTTTLTVTPTTLTHGQTATLTANVASPNATGDVAFTTTAALANSGGLGFGTLASGIATVTAPGTNVTDLPGGTYSIFAQYEGDGTYEPSASAAQTVTVNAEASTAYANLFDWYEGTVIASGASVPYGTQVAVEVQPVGTAVSQTSGAAVGTLSSDGAATGTATFTDGSTTATIPMDAAGIASWLPNNFAVGAHNVTAKYSGDASFKASTSSALAFTVIKGTPLAQIQPFLSGQLTGSSVTVQVFLCAAEGTGCGFGAGTAPTGTVSVALVNGGTVLATQTGTLQPYTSGSLYGGISTLGSGNYSSATVTFTNLPAGATAVSTSYAGDTNWNATAASTQFQTGSASETATTTTLTATPATGTNNASQVTFTSTITGTGSLAPTGTLYITTNSFNNNETVAQIPLTASAGLVSITGDVVTVTTTAPGYYANGGSNQFVAIYSGDTTYLPSTSPAATAAIDQSDFTMVTENPVVTVASGGTGTATIDFASIAGFNGMINLSCISSSGLTCSTASTVVGSDGTSSTGVMLNGVATAVVTITAATSASAHDPLKPFWYAGGGVAIACMMFFGIPARRRGWRSMLGLVLFAVVTFNFGCGGSSGGSGGGGSTPTAAPTFSPAAGAVTSGTKVSIADATSGNVIYYTTDGSTPTTASTKYTSAIAVTKAETISAVAQASGDTLSTVATAAYTITTTTPPSTTGTNGQIHDVTIQVATPSGLETVVVIGTAAVPAT
jgi:hypothetical protein